jgi:hypothetical protein
LSVAVSDVYWGGWVNGAVEVLELTAGGALMEGAVVAGLSGNATGAGEGRCLGGVMAQTVPAGGAAAVVANVLASVPVQGGVRRGWLPIYAAGGAAAGRVVSIGCVDLEADVAPERLQLTKRTGVVGWANASAMLSEPLERAVAADVLAAAALLSGEALQVPASVR